MRPALLVTAVLAALWLWWDVPVGHVLRFGAFAAFTAASGWLLWQWLAGDRAGGRLVQLAVGWALGLVLVVASYLVAAVLGVQGLWWLGPLAVGALAWWKARPPLPRGIDDARGWALAGVTVASLALLSAGFFTQHPLRDHFETVAYHTDVVYTISLSAEAKHRWPLRSPAVAGTPLPYHVFAHIENAAAARLTGLPLDELVMRLMPAMLFVLLALAAAAAARAYFPEHRWAPVLAPALLLLVGEFDPWSSERYRFPFANVFFLDLYLSPTFLLGACLFLPALIVLREVMTGARPGLWVALALLLFGCAGAKATILPVLGVGIAAAVLWGLWRDRALARRAFGTGVLLLAVFVAFYVVQYAGRGGGFDVGRWRSLQQASFLRDLYDDLSPALFEPVSLVLGLLGLAGPVMAGAIGLKRTGRRDVGVALLAGTLVAGIGGLLLLDSVDGSHLYFVWYGYIAGALLAAAGLAALLTARARTALAVVAVLVAGGVLDQPLDLLPAPKPPPDFPTDRGMNRDIHFGLEWVRDHTGPDEVVATNIHTRDDEFDSRYFYVSAFTERRVFIESWLYSARAAELGYREVAGGLQPFPERLALNEAVFTRADRRALAELRRRGVTTLVAYKRYGLGAAVVRRVARLRYENDSLAVFSATPR